LINYTLLKLALFYSSNSLANFAATFLWQEFLKEKVKQGKIELEQVHLTEMFNYFPRDLTLTILFNIPQTCAGWRSTEESYWRYGP
jgi:hypothetical protein